MERKFRITVDGRPYSVTVEELDSPGAVLPDFSAPVVAASVAAKPAAVPASAAPSARPGDVVSALGGVVERVHVEVGASVATGDTLVTLEAMKMKTPVVAQRPGRVASIHVAAGDSVVAGQSLVTLA